MTVTFTFSNSIWAPFVDFTQKQPKILSNYSIVALRKNFRRQRLRGKWFSGYQRLISFQQKINFIHRWSSTNNLSYLLGMISIEFGIKIGKCLRSSFLSCLEGVVKDWVLQINPFSKWVILIFILITDWIEPNFPRSYWLWSVSHRRWICKPKTADGLINKLYLWSFLIKLLACSPADWQLNSFWKMGQWRP